MREEIRIEVAVLRVIAIIFLSYLEVAMASVAVDVGSTSRGIASASSVPFPLFLNAYLVLTAREVVWSDISRFWLSIVAAVEEACYGQWWYGLWQEVVEQEFPLSERCNISNDLETAEKLCDRYTQKHNWKENRDNEYPHVQVGKEFILVGIDTYLWQLLG